MAFWLNCIFTASGIMCILTVLVGVFQAKMRREMTGCMGLVFAVINLLSALAIQFAK